MTKTELIAQVCEWIRSDAPGAPLRIETGVELPDGNEADVLSVRPVPKGIHLALWKVDPGVVGVAAATNLCQALHTLRTACYRAFEERLFRGLGPAREMGVSGHLVGADFEAHPTLTFWSLWAPDLSFWTYRRDESRIELQPYVPHEGGSGSRLARLRRMMGPLERAVHAVPPATIVG
jgi:hypothetical protein